MTTRTRLASSVVELGRPAMHDRAAMIKRNSGTSEEIARPCVISSPLVRPRASSPLASIARACAVHLAQWVGT